MGIDEIVADGVIVLGQATASLSAALLAGISLKSAYEILTNLNNISEAPVETTLSGFVGVCFLGLTYACTRMSYLMGESLVQSSKRFYQ
ncbi:hypothetical protein HYT51_02115 [Candidatus Woesearchaeota archaeon]|nr:hypothetical protein [Candidatus Woesearchaeota archaeon]